MRFDYSDAAFPSPRSWSDGEAPEPWQGMTIRQLYAGMMMAGLLSEPEREIDFSEAAAQAVCAADRLISELKKGEEPS